MRDSSPLIRRTTKIFLELIGALIAGIALLAGFLAWRLVYEGPIHLRFLAPYVERAIAEHNHDFRVGIEDMVLTWAGWPRGLDLRAVNLHVQDRQARDLAVLPQVSITLSIPALLHGLPAPSKVEVLAPHLTLLRQRDGTIMFGIQKLDESAASTGSGNQGPSLARIIEESLSESDPNQSAGYLRSIAVIDGKVAIDDRSAGMQWQAQHVNFSIARNADATLGGSLSAALPQFGTPALATATLNIDPRSGAIAVDTAFQGLELASLGLLESGLTGLVNSDVVLSGRMNTHLGMDGAMGPVDFQVNTANGSLDLGATLKQPLPVQLMQATGRVDVGHDLLHLEKLALDIGGPTIEVAGDVDGLMNGTASDGGAPLAKVTLKAAKYPAEWMDRYWPNGAAANTRAWIVPNITKGMVDHVSVALAMRLPDDAPAKVESMKGEMAASGLTIHYFRPLPPITDGAATATFDSKSFNVDIVAGHVDNIKIEKGAAHITGLDAKDQLITVGGDVSSSLTDALLLIDNPRLGYPTKLGLKPANSSGDSHAKLEFSFPAEKDLTIERVKINVDGVTQHVAMKPARFGQDVTDGTLTMHLNQDGMRVTGPVVYAGMPLDIEWTEDFRDNVDVRETFAAKGKTTSEGRALVGYDFRPWLDGPGDTALKFTRHADGRGVLDTSFDLTDALLALDFAKWRKPAGQPAKGSLTLNLARDRVIDMQNISVEGQGVSLAGAAVFTPDGKSIAKLTLKKAQFGKSSLSDLAVDFTNHATAITIGGGILDVEPWMDERSKPVSTAELDQEELKPQRPLSVAGKLAQVRLSEGETLGNASFDLRHDPIWWDKIFFSGNLPGGAPLTFDYGPDGAGTHRLKVKTDDAGAAFRALGIYGSIKGGQLTVTGAAKDDAPHRAIEGEMKMTSFRLLHTPFAVRFLSVAALTGLVDALTGEGFLFAGASAKFTKTRGRIDVRDFHSAGPSIGLTSRGTIDLDASTVDLKGALVPAYALNSILGNIPIIGEWLQGGKGEGLFSATYSIHGDLNEPKIEVNGWSALAPGFIRNLFSGENTAPFEPKPRSNK